MARILPVPTSEITASLKEAFNKHITEYQAGITNMKSTLGHSLLSFEVYMQWYPLYQEVEKILGKRLAYLYAYAISQAADCPLCSTFFRKIIIDAGETPEKIEVNPAQRSILDFGGSIARYHGNIANHVYNAVGEHYSKEQMVVLIAFAGQMVATNVFNNVIETEIDEYLMDYLPAVKNK